MTQISNGSDEVHQHSGWWFPGVILAAIALLSVGFLLYDLRPGPGSGGGQTGDMAPVRLSLGDPGHAPDGAGQLSRQSPRTRRGATCR